MEIADSHAVPLDSVQEPITVAPIADEDLQYHIRSLLKSRNKRRSPKTPCPSPDLQQPSRHQGQICAGNPPTPLGFHNLDAREAALIFAKLSLLKLNMVATRFHGSASRVTNGFKGSLREPSEPDMRAGRAFSFDGPWSSIESGLSQRATFDASGGESRLSDDVKRADSVSAKSRSKSRQPRYSLRVVPPRHLQINPDAHYVPGSYKSDPSPDGYGTPESGSQHPQDDHRGHDHETLYLHDHFGTIIEPSACATAALDGLKKYDLRPLDVSKRVAHEHEGGIGGGPAPLMAAIPNSRSSSIHAVQADAKADTDSRSASLVVELPTPAAQTETGEPARLSPVSRALSMLSEFSSHSGPRRESSVSVTPSQRRGSVIKPSEIRHVGRSPSTISTTHSENRENEKQPHWVKQLVGKRAATLGSSSNLTARPKTLNTYPAMGDKERRSLTMPLSSDEKKASRHLGTEDTDEAAFVQRQQNDSQSMLKVIVDLENLLKEALTIAGKAASRDVSEAEQDGDVERPRKEPDNENGQIHSTDASENSEAESLPSDGIDQVDNHITSRTGGQIAIVEPEADTSYHGHFKRARDATPYPAQSTAVTRHQSTVPPTDQGAYEVKEVMKETMGIQMLPNHRVKEHARLDTFHHLLPFKSKDCAYIRKSSAVPPAAPQKPPSIQMPLKEEGRLLARSEGMRSQQRPPVIQPRSSSKKLQGTRAPKQEELNLPDHVASSGGSESDGLPYVADYKTSALQYHPIAREVMAGDTKNTIRTGPYPFRPRENTITSLRDKETLTHSSLQRSQSTEKEDYSLKDRHHFSIREFKGFNLSRSYRRKPIARDWSTSRKRLVATVNCITTALMGLILGIYAGEVPALQYALADEHHYTILGNVVFFLGLAITTILVWPLPLLHGRKPYTLAALVILLPLQFPQALAVNNPRSPYVASYRVGVLFPRAFSGLVMGFANINFMTTLLDLFGASLQSGNPHQESVNENDVRRHGGGIGAWLGIWTWCSIMSIGLGFLIGAGVISGLNVSWGFWITIILTATVLLLNVLVPEVRRSPYRRSMAEVRSGTDVSRRVARGEIKMHLESTGPKHWYEEVIAGYKLCFRMLKQPGFMVLALYQGWIFGQIVMVIVVSLPSQ